MSKKLLLVLKYQPSYWDKFKRKKNHANLAAHSFSFLFSFLPPPHVAAAEWLSSGGYRHILPLARATSGHQPPPPTPPTTNPNLYRHKTPPPSSYIQAWSKVNSNSTLIHFLVFVIILVMIYVLMIKINASMQNLLLLEMLDVVVLRLNLIKRVCIRRVWAWVVYLIVVILE